MTTSYFEWVQDRMGYFWTEDEVNQRLDRIMIDSFNDVLQYAIAHEVNNRIAAYMLAIDRVAYTTKQRAHLRVSFRPERKRACLRAGSFFACSLDGTGPPERPSSHPYT